MRRRTISLRLRLTLSYGGVFFALGFLLIAVSYVLVHQVLVHNPGEFLSRVAAHLDLPSGFLAARMPSPSGGQQTVGAFMRTVQDQVVSQLLHGLTGVAFTALAVAAAVSVGLGWLIAGRMLRPVQEIATVARRASASTLHERIAMQGPSDELSELADTFDAMLARLETAFAAQREFVANASHELRTPLSIMRTEVDVTLADPQATSADLRRMADTVRTAIARSEDIIDKLLVLAESGQLVDTETVHLEALTAEVVRRRTDAAQARGLSFALDLREAPVQGDRALLERLVDNLVGNAVRYAGADSVVTVEVGRRPDGAVLRVANAGEVIGPDELPRLFERFYRRGTSRSRRGGGAGLGLAIVAAVAEAHGGTASAASPAGGGLAVTVTLPAAPPDAVRVTSPAVPPDAAHRD
ncbi:MAG: ATP-binding protein [Thermoleophilia bacterium]